MRRTDDWTRIPAQITAEADRREMCAVLASAGLEVRIVNVATGKGSAVRKFVEFRKGPGKITTANVKT